MITILIVLTLLTQPLSATWERPGVARVSWEGAGCLWKDNTFIRCYDAGGVLRMGSEGPLDHAYRPAVGSMFRLVRPDGTQERATLAWRVLLPVWRG